MCLAKLPGGSSTPQVGDNSPSTPTSAPPSGYQKAPDSYSPKAGRRKAWQCFVGCTPVMGAGEPSPCPAFYETHPRPIYFRWGLMLLLLLLLQATANQGTGYRAVVTEALKQTKELLSPALVRVTTLLVVINFGIQVIDHFLPHFCSWCSPKTFDHCDPLVWLLWPVAVVPWALQQTGCLLQSPSWRLGHCLSDHWYAGNMDASVQPTFCSPNSPQNMPCTGNCPNKWVTLLDWPANRTFHGPQPCGPLVKADSGADLMSRPYFLKLLIFYWIIFFIQVEVNATTSSDCVAQIPDKEVFINSFIISLAAAPGNVWTIVHMDKLGRRFFLCLSMLLSGAAAFLIYFLNRW